MCNIFFDILDNTAFEFVIYPIFISSSVCNGTDTISLPFKSGHNTPVQIVYPFKPISRLNKVALSLTRILFL